MKIWEKIRTKIIHRLGGFVWSDLTLEEKQRIYQRLYNNAVDRHALQVFKAGFETNRSKEIMTYDLAKKLEQAGFPFKTQNVLNDEHVERGRFFLETGHNMPDLAELIEACGDGFVYLQRGGQYHPWVAAGAYADLEKGYKKFEGSTSHEAMVNLYLYIKARGQE